MLLCLIKAGDSRIKFELLESAHRDRLFFLGREKMTAQKVLTIILGVVVVFIGFYCIFVPSSNATLLAYMVSLGSIIYGVGALAGWHATKQLGFADGWALAAGLLSIIFGVAIAISGAMQLAVDLFIVYMIAAWLLFLGILRIGTAFGFRRVGKITGFEIFGPHWLWPLAWGILLILLAVFCFVYPGIVIWALGIFVGVSLIIAGCNLISVATLR